MMCVVSELTSAVPESLASFGAASSEQVDRLLALVGGAAGDLPSACGQPWGVGAAAAAGLARVSVAVPAHAARAESLGAGAAAVGAAFEAAGGGGAGVVWAEHETVAEWILERVGAGQLEIPDTWATLVPGVGGCPALSLPVWVRDASEEDLRSLTEPLAAPMQLLCQPETESEARTGSVAWLPGEVVLGPGGTVVMTPGTWAEIGTVSEARRRGGSGGTPQEPPPERRMPMPPALSPIWQDAERYRGPIRRNDRGEYMMWDYLHGEIEMFGRNGRHLGAADPLTGELIKPPVPTRRLPD